MANTPKSRDELARLTNLEDLVEAPLARQEHRYLQPAADVSDPTPPKRSTTDPFESNFGEVDMVAGIAKPGTKPWVRTFAWVFLAGPGLVLWCMGVVSLFDVVATKPQTPGAIAAEAGAFLVGTVVAGFWPYLLLRRN